MAYSVRVFHQSESGSRENGDSKSGICPDDGSSGIVIFTENMGNQSGFPERFQKNWFPSPVQDQWQAGEIGQGNGILALKITFAADCQKRFFNQRNRGQPLFGKRGADQCQFYETGRQLFQKLISISLG